MLGRPLLFPGLCTDYILKMGDIKAFRFIVQGRVQGVGYRWFVFNEAKNLNICGFVKNLVNGNVEVLAQGDLSSVYKLKDRLKSGPSFSRVEKIIETEDVFNEQLKDFKVTY
jgi:acylphosphatase